MNNIVLFPTNEDYCKKCIYNTEMSGCRNKEYQKIYIMLLAYGKDAHIERQVSRNEVYIYKWMVHQ